MDIPLLVIIVLLASTLIAFFTGAIPYPYGLIVLFAFLVARLLVVRGRKH
jgi:hypothetical protein